MAKKFLGIGFCLLLVLLSACSLPGSGRALNGTSAAVTTLCPQTGTARAAVAPPMTLGKHANLIYYVGDTSNPNDNAAVLSRIDVITNRTTQVARLSNANITEAQVSTDGQWVLFTIQIQSPHPHIELRLIRVDGRYQQTLFCLPQSDNSSYSTLVGHFVWSPDDTSVALTGLTGIYNLPAIYLLDLAQGQAQVELESAIGQQQKGLVGNAFPQYTEIYFPAKWLDNTHLYIDGRKQSSSQFGQSQNTLYQLDTGKGAQQHSDSMKTVFSEAVGRAGLVTCAYDSSADGSQLFVARCTSQDQGGLFQGPSTITVQPTNGGQGQAIYHTSTLAVVAIEVASSRTVLFLGDSAPGNGYTGNSIWKLNVGGSGLTSLAANGRFSWCGALQSSCTNVSRDGSLYALVSLSNSGDTLLYGSLDGGSLKPVATLNSLYTAFVGWTAM